MIVDEGRNAYEGHYVQVCIQRGWGNGKHERGCGGVAERGRRAKETKPLLRCFPAFQPNAWQAEKDTV
jgi:hypothetical protein